MISKSQSAARRRHPAPRIAGVGVNGGLFGATLLYCCYIGSFYLATVITHERLRFYIALVGAVTGGVAGAILFTAQGIFFTMTAQQLSALWRPGDATGTLPEITSKLAGVFASIYLLCEVVFKLVATILPKYLALGFEVVFLIYLAMATTAAFCMLRVRAPASVPSAEPPRPSSSWLGSCGWELLGTLRLLLTDSRACLVIGTNLAFGFSSVRPAAAAPCCCTLPLTRGPHTQGLAARGSQQLP